MAIQFVGSNKVYNKDFSNISLTALTGGISASVQSGDVVVVTTVIADTGTYANNTYVGTYGYTAISDQRASGLYPFSHEICYKVMGATPDTVVPHLAYTKLYSTTVLVFRGVNTTTPLDVAASKLITYSGPHDPPSVTTVTNGAMIVVAVGAGYSLNTNPSATGPSGYSTPVYTGATSSGANPASWCCFKLQSTAGTENPGTFSSGAYASTSGNGLVTLALRPAASAAAGGIKVWNGSAWVAKPVKVWNGSAWVTKPVKRWNGTAWVTTPY